MPAQRYAITASDGKEYKILADDPSEAVRMEAFINERLAAGDTDPNNWNPDNAVVRKPSKAQRLKQAQDKLGGKAGYQTLLTQGASFGLSDEAAGVGNAFTSLLQGDTDFSGNYAAGRDAERSRIEDARQSTGGTGFLAELGGGLVGAAPTAALRTLMGLGQASRAGAIGGAAAGAVGGFGTGEGTGNSVAQAGVGTAVGGFLGAALPVVGSVIGNRIGGLQRMFATDRAPIARQIVGQAIEADANTATGVGRQLAQARERGSPLAIADTGENARETLASVSRQPGPARTIATEFAGERQTAQSDRVVGSIGRNLGRIGNVREESDALMQQARTAADPLYEEFRAGAGRTSDELEAILQTPAGKAALGKARTIASNERRDPNKMGFDLDDQGETILTQVPSPETLDLIKRGLDDIIEEARDPVTRQIAYTPSLRAVEDVRKSLIREADNLHPAYAQARAAFAGPASAEEALQLGRNSLNSSAEDIEAALSRMGDAEREQYALGFRAAMADNVGRATDGTNLAQRMLGTPRKRAALASVFREPLPTAPEGFKNVIHDRPALQVGRPNNNDLVTEDGFTYRSLSPEEIADAKNTGGFLPNPSGKSSGGRKNVKHWVKGGQQSGQFFREGQVVVRVPNNKINAGRPVHVADAEIWGGSQNWSQVSSGDASLQRFVETLGDERATSETFNSVARGSQTALRNAFDNTTNDTGIAETAANVAIKGASHPLALLGDALQALGDVNRFGPGQAGNATRESVAALLTETDPTVLDELSRAIRRANYRQRIAGRTANGRAAAVGAPTVNSGVAALNSLSPEPR